MNYKEYKEKSQEEFNALPIFFAFSNKQFEEEMKKRGLTINDTDKIYKLGHTGGFYLKSDADIIRKYMETPSELPDLMKNPEFAYDAFLYEMYNHEYGINWEADYDVLSCFGKIKYTDEDDDVLKYFDELNFTPETRNAYYSARKTYYKETAEWL